VFLKGMYHFNCASVKGRGGNRAIRYLDKILVDDHKNTKYCLKIDIKKFYPSIDKTILKQKFRGVIKDNKVLLLLDRIVDSVESGVPIGNYTSQWFANFYLQDFDHFIKEKLKIPYYVRYMDDMILIHNDKEYLKYCLSEITKCVENELKLKLNNKTQISKLNQGIDFLGFRNILCDNGKVIRLLRLQAKQRLRKNLKKLSKFRQKDLIDDDYVKIRLNSFKAYLCHANCNSLYTSLKHKNGFK